VLGAGSVILDDDGRVLLVKHGYGELNWEVPGGRGEDGESAEETARREAREEVRPPANHHFVFRARALGEPHVADLKEISAVGWFSPDELPRPMSDFTVRRITDAIAHPPAGVWTIGPRVWLR